MAIQVDHEACMGCGRCIESCPMNARNLNGGKAHVDSDRCVECRLCMEVCAHEANHCLEECVLPVRWGA